MFSKLFKLAIFILAVQGGPIFAGDITNGQNTSAALPHIAILKATTNAPAIAAGRALILFPPIFYGGIASNLHVTATGLLGGVYTVSITDVETNTYDLGTFTMPTFTNGFYGGGPVPFSPAGAIDYVPSIPAIAIGVGSGAFPLPDGLAVSNIVGVSVADSNAVVDLEGIFNAPISIAPREFREDVLLATTNDAPPGATGRAELVDHAGTNLAVVTVEAEGLLDGAYTVNLTDKTGTNTFLLGDLEVNPVSPWTNIPGFAHPDFIIFGSTNTAGHAQFPLPVGLDPSNAVTISVVDSNAVVKLTGDFKNPISTLHCGFQSHITLIPGPICSNLLGEAQLLIKVIKNKPHNKFSLVAEGAPQRQTFSLMVNGAYAGNVKSTRQGRIAIRKLPQGIDLVNVMTVEADDSEGNVIFNANF